MFGEVVITKRMKEVLGGGGRSLRRSGVHEVGASLETAHGSGGAVVGAGGFLRGVEGSQPPSLLGLRVPNLGGVTSPRPAPHATVPHGSAAAVFP